MKIELEQDEIEQAIRDHLSEMGVNVEDKELSISFSQRRIPNQSFTAEIEITRAQAAAPEPEPTAEAGTKTRAARQPRKPAAVAEATQASVSETKAAATSEPPPWEEVDNLNPEETAELTAAVARVQAEQSGLFSSATPTAPAASPLFTPDAAVPIADTNPDSKVRLFQ